MLPTRFERQVATIPNPAVFPLELLPKSSTLEPALVLIPSLLLPKDWLLVDQASALIAKNADHCTISDDNEWTPGAQIRNPVSGVTAEDREPGESSVTSLAATIRQLVRDDRFLVKM
jgi:hypothetical protein